MAVTPAEWDLYDIAGTTVITDTVVSSNYPDVIQFKIKSDDPNVFTQNDFSFESSNTNVIASSGIAYNTATHVVSFTPLTGTSSTITTRLLSSMKITVTSTPKTGSSYESKSAIVSFQIAPLETGWGLSQQVIYFLDRNPITISITNYAQTALTNSVNPSAKYASRGWLVTAVDNITANSSPIGIPKDSSGLYHLSQVSTFDLVASGYKILFDQTAGTITITPKSSGGLMSTLATIWIVADDKAGKYAYKRVPLYICMGATSSSKPIQTYAPVSYTGAWQLAVYLPTAGPVGTNDRTTFALGQWSGSATSGQCIAPSASTAGVAGQDLPTSEPGHYYVYSRFEPAEAYPAGAEFEHVKTPWTRVNRIDYSTITENVDYNNAFIINDPIPTSITVTTPYSKTYDNSPIYFNVTLSNDVSGTLAYGETTSRMTQTIHHTGGTGATIDVPIIDAGHYRYYFKFTPDSVSYLPSSAVRSDSVSIYGRNLYLLIENQSKEYDGTTLQLDGSYQFVWDSSLAPGHTISVQPVYYYAPEQYSTDPVGPYVCKYEKDLLINILDEAGNNINRNYNWYTGSEFIADYGPEPAYIEITKRVNNITISISPNTASEESDPTKRIVGDAPEFTYTSDNLLPGDSVTVSDIPHLTNSTGAGKYPIEFYAEYQDGITTDSYETVFLYDGQPVTMIPITLAHGGCYVWHNGKWCKLIKVFLRSHHRWIDCTYFED